MLSVRSAAELKLSLVRALRLSAESQASMRLRQEADVGVKCRCQRSRLGWASQSRTGLGLARGEVVQHDVDIEVCGGVQVDPSEEVQHVAAGVPSAGLAQHLAGGNVERGEEVHGAVALVVVGEGAGPARSRRQRGLGAVEGLDLAFSSKLNTAARSVSGSRECHPHQLAATASTDPALGPGSVPVSRICCSRDAPSLRVISQTVMKAPSE